MAAALSEAAADTVSSEVGQAFGEKARLITTWRSVPAGTDGGVSLIGTAAGIAAAGVVSSVCLLGGLLPPQWLAISIGPAILGMIADSFLGAGLERRGLVNNDIVNFLGTLTRCRGRILAGRDSPVDSAFYPGRSCTDGPCWRLPWARKSLESIFTIRVLASHCFGRVVQRLLRRTRKARKTYRSK